MQYHNIKPAVFLARPNRFIARVRVDGTELAVHVKNTGRCRELLVPGCRVYLEPAENPARKTPYSLVAVEKGERLINMDSAAPNVVVAEAIRGGLLLPGMDAPARLYKPEVRFGDSRLDGYLETPGLSGYIEVKGVTLEENGVVRFPDAPTERGVRHLGELERAVALGKYACAVFVIQMEQADYFTPNDATHPEFGAALRHAAGHGVQIAAYSCRVTPDTLMLSTPVKVEL